MLQFFGKREKLPDVDESNSNHHLLDNNCNAIVNNEGNDQLDFTILPPLEVKRAQTLLRRLVSYLHMYTYMYVYVYMYGFI